MKRSLVAIFATIFATNVIAAPETDENGLVPKHWFKLDGNMAQSGSTELTMTSLFDTSKYVNSKLGMAGVGARPYSTGNLSLPANNGAWTFVTTATSSGKENDVLWGIGSKKSNYGLMLVSTGSDGVKLVSWSNGAVIDTPLVTAKVADATTAFHTFAVTEHQIDSYGRVVRLYVDGRFKGSAKIGGNVSEPKLQLGSHPWRQPRRDGSLQQL